jgi:hypothetical protein
MVKPQTQQQPQTFGSGNLLKDIEAQMDEDDETVPQNQPTMIDLFFGTKK